MEPRKYVAYNQTRDSLLSSSVTSVNAGLEPLKVLKVLIEGLPANSRTGLWLTNFKGVPVARTLSPFDLVYLDKDNRVVQGVELSKDGEFAPSKGQPASALVLPSKSLTTSRTKEGDQLELRVVELEAQPEQVPAPVALPPTPADLAPSQPIEPSPAEPSPSARFFSSGASAVEAPISSAEFRVSPTPISFPDAAATESVTPSERPEAEAVELPIAPVPKPQSEPFWTEKKSYARTLVPETPAPAPEPPSPVEPLPNAEVALPSAVPPLAIQEAPVSVPQYGDYGPVPRRKYTWKIRLLRWLFPELVIGEAERPRDRRRADRQSLPGLIAYYFTGGAPEPHKISNISVTGFYLHTDERWMPGTVVRMTLQRVGSKGDDPSDIISVNSKIVRWGADGEGFEFILTDLDE
ncbi:MAG TPA: hypothetical protein VMR02_04460 [Terracidiphilus sp.]|jgi:hypothetical protein|nr:hypothetical protein [Terracidiphilus sp.]